MRRFLRVLLLTVAVLIFFLVVIVAGGWLWLRGSLPQTSGTVQIAGLSAPVEIVRDAAGVPHIFAATDADAIFGLGYVHAQDRMWQLEMNRRIGNGRMSEVLGEATLDIDKYQRTMGYRRAAEQAWEVLSPEGRAALEAYAAGVNGWINEGHRLPPEYLLLGFTPEPWTVYDSLVWIKMMQYDLGGDYELEILRSRLAATLGPERAAQVMPEYPAGGPDILPPDALDEITSAGMLALKSRIETALGLDGKDAGSNNWVISGDLTETGMPLLANDPHLGASIPSVWYLAEVQGDRLHVSGATFPAVPLFPIGHNEQIAWGVTNVNPDVQDLYIERVNPANANQVEYNGEWEDMTIVEELIVVDGRDEPLRWAARSTRNGPLVSDVQGADTTVALRWTALDPDDTTLDAYLGVNYARNWQEFRDAMRAYVAPSQNFVYADVGGNIGYFVPGRIPVRKSGNGMLPTPGWNDDSAWTGWIPFDDLPQSYNPEQGYIATANNRVVGDDYPYHLSSDWSEPYRAQRIVELIEENTAGGEKISLEEMKQMQADQASAQVRTQLPFFLSITPATDRQRAALALLQEWDGVATLDSPAQPIYAAWRVHLERAILEDEFRGNLWEEMASRAHPLFFETLLDDPALQAVWCDNVLTAGAESCADVALDALDRALDDLTERMGDDMANWSWGRIHITQYPHRPFSNVSYLKWIFHRSIPNGGDGYTVNVAPFRRTELFNQYHVPSYRTVVDLQDFQRSLFITTTGQSGNVLSSHYADFIRPHRDVEYLPMTWGRAAVSGDTLRLEPGN